MNQTLVGAYIYIFLKPRIDWLAKISFTSWDLKSLFREQIDPSDRQLFHALETNPLYREIQYRLDKHVNVYSSLTHLLKQGSVIMIK